MTARKRLFEVAHLKAIIQRRPFEGAHSKPTGDRDRLMVVERWSSKVTKTMVAGGGLRASEEVIEWR